MKRLLLLPALLALAPHLHAGDVGVSVTVDKPGFYGSIDIGDVRPRTVNVQPVIIAPVAGVRPAPVYMHVPPGQAKKWARYCHQYQACGRPVYFVREDWYEREYLPHKSGKAGHKSANKGGKVAGRGHEGPGKGGKGNGKHD